MRIQTTGGRFQVRWDENCNATALRKFPFLAEFLEVSSLFERWVEGCPMTYPRPNAPEVRDVLFTWLLSILDGQRRYAHVTGLRGDAVTPEILDTDTPIKLLYVHQDGAEISYNTTKPGRPSHVIKPTGSPKCAWCLARKSRTARPMQRGTARLVSLH